MLTLRKAKISDIELINTLGTKAFTDTYAQMLSSDQISFMLNWMYSIESLSKQFSEGHIYYVAYDGDSPCGYISIQKDSPDVFHLQKIYLLKTSQGKGYGKILFQEAINHIKREHPGPCQMILNVNRDNKAVEFYERMGMRKLSSGDFPIGNGYLMTDYIMGIDI